MADHPLMRALDPHARPAARPATLQIIQNPTNGTGTPVCGAKVRHPSDVKPHCMSTALGPVNSKGFRRCRMHGGFTPRGPEHPGYKTGAYSKAMPGGPLREAYERHLAEPELLSLKNDIALVTAEIEMVLAGVSTGHVKALPGAVDAVEVALRARDPAGLTMALDNLKAQVKGANDEAASVDRLVVLRTHKARLARTEHLRAIAAATMIDASAAWALVHAMIELVRSHVPDPGSRQAIVEGLVRLTGRDALPRPGGRQHAE